jgi:hypothetical protein
MMIGVLCRYQRRVHRTGKRFDEDCSLIAHLVGDGVNL